MERFPVADTVQPRQRRTTRSAMPVENSPASSEPQWTAEPPPAAQADTFTGTLRELLRVAIPLIVSSGSQSLMHVTDRIFLTRSSVDAVAASLPSGVLFWA